MESSLRMFGNAQSGTVIGFVGALVRVATARGVIEAEYVRPLNKGDRVAVLDNRVVRITRGEGLVHHV
ncbi:MAG: hypothetical protein HQL98_15615 [Magnetococcales bacterium]|nr:hypothetical protein [Magnetococcales bacterium]